MNYPPFVAENVPVGLVPVCPSLEQIRESRVRSKLLRKEDGNLLLVLCSALDVLNNPLSAVNRSEGCVTDVHTETMRSGKLYFVVKLIDELSRHVTGHVTISFLTAYAHTESIIAEALSYYFRHPFKKLSTIGQGLDKAFGVCVCITQSNLDCDPLPNRTHSDLLVICDSDLVGVDLIKAFEIIKAERSPQIISLCAMGSPELQLKRSYSASVEMQDVKTLPIWSDETIDAPFTEDDFLLWNEAVVSQVVNWLLYDPYDLDFQFKKPFFPGDVPPYYG